MTERIRAHKIAENVAALLQVQASRGKNRGPIFTAVSAPRGGQYVPQQVANGQLPLMQMGYDAAQLLRQEYHSMTIRRRRAKIADLEAQLADNPLPGFQQASRCFFCCSTTTCINISRQASVLALLAEAHNSDLAALPCGSCKGFSATDTTV